MNSVTVTDASGPEQNNGTITLDISGGTPPYSVAWSNGASGASIGGLVPGDYTYVITDANGCQYTSPAPVTVNSITATSDINWPEYVTVSPNPTKGEVVIKWSSSPYKNATLSVMTLDGKLIKSQTMSQNEGKWDLTPLSLSNGLYIILLKQEDQVFPFKLIVL